MPRSVLVSSAGRRVGLLGCFRDSCLGTTKVNAVDCSPTAPAAQFADNIWLVPRCDSPAFVESVLNICVREKVGLLVPTIDPELPVYAAASSRFRASGTTVCISSPEAIQIGADKTATNKWLTSNGFPTVRQSTPDEVLDSISSWSLPLIAKPRGGSASIGLRRIDVWDDLEVLAGETSYIVEEKAIGREFTLNAYVGRDGQCVCVVPHWRVEVRAGEVSKGVTVKHPTLISLGRRIAEALPGAWGPLNIQCFMDDSGQIRVFEINMRFGGGYPLAHRAGAKFTSWLFDEIDGRCITPFDDWQDDLAMLRFDDAVYLPGGRIGMSGHA